jgi:hypothetical protein
MWALLQLHAKQCTVADCPVLRCRELRQMRRLQMARQEEKRRVAYKNMLRNQVCIPCCWAVWSAAAVNTYAAAVHGHGDVYHPAGQVSCCVVMQA